MLRTMLRAKIHRATVTDASLHYAGSLTIPRDLMRKLDILEGEQVLIANVTTGERWVTYAISGTRRGRVSLNGAAARYGQIGDTLIIMLFAQVDEKEARRFRPRIAQMGPGNRVVRIRR